jgi:hypothetical protein
MKRIYKKFRWVLVYACTPSNGSHDFLIKNAMFSGSPLKHNSTALAQLQKHHNHFPFSENCTLIFCSGKYIVTCLCFVNFLNKPTNITLYQNVNLFPLYEIKYRASVTTHFEKITHFEKLLSNWVKFCATATHFEFFFSNCVKSSINTVWK